MLIWRRTSAPRLVVLVGAVALLGVAVDAAPITSQVAAPPQTTVTFECTGAPQNWTVPEGVTSARFDVSGAQGGVTATFAGHDNFGGRSLAILPVAPGETLQVNAGCMGMSIFPPGAPAGWNGGGVGGWSGHNGGGASDVRRGGTSLADRIIVAGGGGGVTLRGGRGGQGSGANGRSGTASIDAGSAGPGAGGTATSGGAGGAAGTDGQPGTPGVLGVGGDAVPITEGFGAGGGGGGGYYGGGGGGTGSGDPVGGGGGGGGSGLCPAFCVAAETGVRPFNGIVKITYPFTLSDLTSPEPVILEPRFTG